MTHMTSAATDLSTGLVALVSLCDGFHEEAQVRAAAEPVVPDTIPTVLQQLLVHREHMTTTLEAHHGTAVALHVLRRRQEGDDYAREIVLTTSGSERVVEFGIVRMNLRLITPEAREEILAGDAPLGDILIRHDVMRRIDPKWYFRVRPTSCFARAFHPQPATDLFGRLGVIHCNGQPAIRLLEVVGDVRAVSDAVSPE
jgi:chorismate-pyruvate lyase